MRETRNENGIALVTALLITLISLAIILAVIYLSTQGTTTSALAKRYQTALDASNGAAEIVTKDIIPLTINGTMLTSALGSFPLVYQGLISSNVTDTCFTDKMTKSTADWSNCTADNKSLSLRKTNNTVVADMTIKLSPVSPSQPNFRVYTKVVDTIKGNTDTSGMVLDGTGVVEAGSGIVIPQHFPYVYRIEVQGERDITNPDERAKLSVLYAY